MIKIISSDRYEELVYREGRFLEMIKELSEPQLTYNCGYKSCQFQTTDQTGLKIHRSRIHKNK